ncbi:MAG: serine--tRNA ligase [Cyanobacteria bacterium HKST-UBA06]|nr:serine--tRNA ligase [Cyanobacteria bacterium HKST-UBA06]
MLDIRLIRQSPDEVNAALARRGGGYSIDSILAMDETRRELMKREEALRSERNTLSKEVGRLKQVGQDTDDLQARTKALADEIKDLELQKKALEDQQDERLKDFPNLPDAKTPDGKDETDNVLVRQWGDEFKNRFTDTPKPHWEIGSDLNLIDFERGVKLAQSRFSIMRGAGARLERALINYMLDTHSQTGYEEIVPPFLVNAEAMTGTGQLPKFESDMFATRDDALYLVPTAEVPLTNIYGAEIIDYEAMPKYFMAYTPCFRREAGAAGRDTRGLIRQHQFNKVELVKLVTPETAEAEHLALTRDAEAILQGLELPYRVMELCTGDLGYNAARCFDLEVWLPSAGLYREISSCSHFGDFQARRASLKYRSPETGKSAYLHTINGSGLAVGRTVAAILENYQTADGTIKIPQVLQPYMGGLTELKETEPHGHGKRAETASTTGV